MGQADKKKIIAFGLSLFSLALFFAGIKYFSLLTYIAAALAVFSLFMVTFSPHKSGRLFTFTLFFNSAVIGFMCDFPFNDFPLTLVILELICFIFISRTLVYKSVGIFKVVWLEMVIIGLLTIAFAVGAWSLNFNLFQWLTAGFPIAHFAFFAVVVFTDRKEAGDISSKIKIEPGTQAPPFTLPDQNGHPVSLSTILQDSHALLIFVRGDWCPTCHMMLRGYIRNKEKFAEKNVRIIGVGPDPTGVNKDIMNRLDPESLMLSDEEQAVGAQYVLQLQKNNPVTKALYKSGIPLPASFLIHKSGKIIFTSRSDKAGEILEPDKIFEALNSLS